MTIDFRHRFDLKGKPLHPGYVIAYITHFVAIPEETGHFSRSEINELVKNLLMDSVDNAVKDFRRSKINVDGKRMKRRPSKSG